MPDENVDELRGKELSVPVKAAKQQQKIKAFPDVIAGHMEDDKDLIIILEEINPHQKSSTYGKPFHVVTSVKGKPPDECHCTTFRFSSMIGLVWIVSNCLSEQIYR